MNYLINLYEVFDMLKLIPTCKHFVVFMRFANAMENLENFFVFHFGRKKNCIL